MAFAHALDLLVPIANLGQKGTLSPHGPQAVAYLLIFAGWALATAVLTGVARVLSRG